MERKVSQYRSLFLRLLSLLKRISLGPQGNYAFAVTWSDGHQSSLYTYDHLSEVITEYSAAP